MTTRPLLRKTIAQLEEMFAAKPSDADTLKALDTELQFRNVPRATALLRKVKSVLTGGNSLIPSAQPELFISTQAPSPTIAVPISTPPVVILPKVAAKPAPPVAEIPPMALDEAYKILRVTAGASWAEVEQSRSKIVQRAHPDTVAELSAEKRTSAQIEAKRANAAYSVLLEARSQ
jgi:hypothetical protein